MPSKPKNIRVFLGKGGKGKSVLVRHQLKAFKRVLIFDANEEPENAQGAVVCYTKSDLARAVNAFNDPFRVCWRGFEKMGRAAYEYANEVAMQAENLTLHWEEVDRFIGPRELPKHADEIINAGRHKRIGIFACARRAAKIPRDLTANANRIIVFGSNEPIDVKYVRDHIGKEWADKVTCLEDYHAIDWTEKKAAIKKSPFR